MSYNYDDYDEQQRQRRYEIEASRRVQFIPWESDMHAQVNASGNTLPSCDMCHRVLVIRKSDANNWFCGDCGNTTPVNPEPPKVKPKRMKPKQPGSGGPSLIIASQKTKRKKRSPLEGISDDSNLELRKELVSLGVIDYATAEEY